jgi:hypothetical protein
MDAETCATHRVCSEGGREFFDPESTVPLHQLCTLEDNDFDGRQQALRIVRRSADLSMISVGDRVRTLSYCKILDLARSRGLKPAPFEDIRFPVTPFTAS